MAAPGRQSHCGRRVASLFAVTLWVLSSAPQVDGDQSQGAVFLREFTLIRRESLNEDFLPDLLNNNHKTEDTEQLNKLVLTYRTQIVSLLCILDTHSALHLYHLCSKYILPMERIYVFNYVTRAYTYITGSLYEYCKFADLLSLKIYSDAYIANIIKSAILQTLWDKTEEVASE